MPKGQKGPGFSVKQEREKPTVIVVRMSIREGAMQVTVRGTEDPSEAIAALEQAHDVLLTSSGLEDDSSQEKLSLAATGT